MLRALDSDLPRRWDVALLHRVAVGLARADTFDAAANLLAREVVGAIGRANECTVSVWRKDLDALVTAACFYDDESQTDGSEGEYTGEVYSLEHRPESRELLDRGCGYSELRIGDAGLPLRLQAEMREWTWKSVVQLPLVSQGQAIGLMDVVDYTSARRWNVPDVALLELVATLAALAMRVSVLEELRHRVDHDPLTDLLHHRAFFERLRAELARAHRSGDAVCLLVLDLDNFKRLNDTKGHLAGDQALRRTADALRGACRQYDVAGRIGGDEFAMILTGIPPAAAHTAARRVLRAIAASTMLTASIGFTQARPNELDELLVMGRADAALLRAKRNGKHTVCRAA